jgi:hypothetical protein
MDLKNLKFNDFLKFKFLTDFINLKIIFVSRALLLHLIEQAEVQNE